MLGRRALFLAPVLALALAPLVVRAEGDAPSTEKPAAKRVLIAREGDSFLEEIDGQRVLHLAGDHHAMGFAHGKLLKQEARECVDAYVKVFALGVAHHTMDQLREVYEKAKSFIPQEYQDEMRGLAEGSGIPLEEVQIAHIVPELHHCSGAALFGDMTADGKLYHYRSLDYSLQLGSGKKVQENACLILRKPAKGYASVVVGWAGTLGCVTGMSAEGISIGEMGSSSLAESFTGTPMWFRLRWILENCRTLDEGMAGFRDWKRTCGYNFIIADGKIPDARAVEVDQDRVAFFAPGGAEENVAPHWAIKSCVRRVNHFVDPELAGRQRRPYDPRVSERNSWEGYRRISEYLEANRGKLDGERMIALCRGYPKEHSCLHQAVFCPTDLRFWVANAKDPDKVKLAGAQNQTFYPYDLKALLATDPTTLGAVPSSEPRKRLAELVRELRDTRRALKTATQPGEEFDDALRRLSETLAETPSEGPLGPAIADARRLADDMARARAGSEALPEKLEKLGAALDAIAKRLEPAPMTDTIVPDGAPAERERVQRQLAELFPAKGPDLDGWMRDLALLAGEPTGHVHAPALPTGPASDDPVTKKGLDHLATPESWFPYRLEQKLRLDTYVKHALRYPSAAHTRAESDLVSGFYYEPARRGNERVPGVVVVHHLGGGFEAEEVMAAYFAQHGLAAITISLPGYGPRKAPGQPKTGFVGSPDPRDDLAGMRQAVLDVCRAADVLRARPEVDPARVGTVGVSLGALVAADAAGFDPRFARAVFVIGGGDLFSVIANESPETRGQLERAHRAGLTDELLKQGFSLIDPVTFASRLRSQDVLMLNAEKDEIFPRACTLGLWRKAGYPRIKWYDCGHYGIVAHLPDAMNEALDHLKGVSKPRQPD